MEIKEDALDLLNKVMNNEEIIPYTSEDDEPKKATEIQPVIKVVGGTHSIPRIQQVDNPLTFDFGEYSFKSQDQIRRQGFFKMSQFCDACAPELTWLVGIPIEMNAFNRPSRIIKLAYNDPILEDHIPNGADPYLYEIGLAKLDNHITLCITLIYHEKLVERLMHDERFTCLIKR